MKRIGIYGGTFNPPHIGHMEAARHAVSSLQLDKLLLIPDRIAPHKVMPADSPTPWQRYEMLQLAAQSVPNGEVCDIELRREGPSFTYQTILELARMYPDSELVLFMGTDMFCSFQTWREPDTILKHASLGVFYRGERNERQAIEQQKKLLEEKGARVYLLENPVIPISSTDLRRMLVFGCAAPVLPNGVEAFIRKNGLYGANSDLKGLSMDELEKTVLSLLKSSRVNHVLGCRDTAVELARYYGANETDAARAGLLHDITKALDGPLQLTLCDEYGIMLSEFFEENPKTLHALTGSFVAERIFGENSAVVSAVRYHTTGKADMSLLEKIIYVADYMEPNRNFPGVDKLRQLAFTDIDAALKLGLEMTLRQLQEQGSTVSVESREALDYLNQLPKFNCV